RPGGTRQAEYGDEAREGDERDRGRHEISEEYRHAQRLRPRPGHARERVSRRHRERERDHHHGNSEEACVREPLQILGILEQDPEVMQGWWVVEQVWIVRRVVEILCGFEGRNHHPVERKGEEGHEERQNPRVSGVAGDPAGASGKRRHQVTSARRANHRKTIATATKTGNRNSEIAAPPARSPPWMPVK